MLERPEGRLGPGRMAATPWVVGAVALVSILVFAALVTWKVRRALAARRGPVSSRRGGSLRPPPPTAT